MTLARDASTGGPAGALPDPWSEIRLLGVSTVPGANFWRSGPVTRLDLHPGAYDEISSAAVPGFTEALLGALPGLWEHRCSVGERGGFVTRLRRGTYAPHIVEHVALELQSMAGHDVGYGRARGGDRPGEYVVVLAHRHAGVGRLAALRALEVVRRALVGGRGGVREIVAELRAAGEGPDRCPPPAHRVAVGITGGPLRAAIRRELVRGGLPDEVVEVAPEEILRCGLPFAGAAVAVVADGCVADVPERYREPEMARQLLGVIADAVPPGGVVVLPADQWALEREIRGSGRRVALFAGTEGIDPRDARCAHATAAVECGRIVMDCAGEDFVSLPLEEDSPPAAQAAAVLVRRMLEES